MVSVMNRADRKSWSSLSSRPFSPTEVSTRQQGRCGPSSLSAFLLNRRNWYLLVIIMVGRPPYPERPLLTSSASSRRRVCDPIHSLFLPTYMSVPSVVSVSRSSLAPKSLCLTHRRVEPGSSVCIKSCRWRCCTHLQSGSRAPPLPISVSPSLSFTPC